MKSAHSDEKQPIYEAVFLCFQPFQRKHPSS